MLFIGLDLGTSSLKGLLVDRAGKILRTEQEEYAVSYPYPGWSEQNPEDWLRAAKAVLARLSEGVREEIAGVSVGGQMHGLVLLDREDRVIRPAILWNDGRTSEETDFLNETVGRDVLSEQTANIAFAGFTAPKILWVKRHEPEHFEKIAKLMLPKDYLAYCLTGVFSTDYSDASGTLLLDVRNKCWSRKMCELCSVRPEWLPNLFESYERTGRIKPEYGLPHAVFAAGAGDNAAAAIGTGTVADGDCNLSLGTSGTVFIAGDRFTVDPQNALHAFVHATGKWHLMGCILSAASCNKWWLETILKTDDYAAETEGCEELLGRNGVWFLPYLSGERSPHNDVFARGGFLGLSAETGRAEMNLAVLEGVAFALRDCVEVARANGLRIASSKICGGGAKSELWCRIIANVLQLEIDTIETEQGAGYGAAILAMVGCGAYRSVQEACVAIVKIGKRFLPDAEVAARYDRRYSLYRKLYPALKDLFFEMSRTGTV